MLNLLQISSLEKVFLKKGQTFPEYTRASALLGEEFCYQVMFWSEELMDLTVSVQSEPAAELFLVGNVPSQLPCYPTVQDQDYLTYEPGLFPDILLPIQQVQVRGTQFAQAIWVCLRPEKAGEFPVTVRFENPEKGVDQQVTFTLKVIDVSLPEQTLKFTQWFHGDCIATYYQEEVWSESHWRHLEQFIKTAVQHGINMLLTPIFTPPLDTQVGGERPTIQLVDVILEGGNYRFGFDKLRRWIVMCKQCGIRYFEISHLFTQWGARSTPKIIARVDGEQKRIFGWDTDALSEQYQSFLAAFLPELTRVLREEKIDQVTFFHISDEPRMEDLEHYRRAAESILPYLEGFQVIDALSNYEFYQQGVVKHPIPSSNHIEPFLGMDHLWTYYCCSQGEKVSNRFFAMPSYRNRIMGIQLYKYQAEGFLHWGYNFYYSRFSRFPINPYQVTDAACGFPSGDAFSVYPGADGSALPSLRLKVFYHGLQDMRVLSLLETKMPREEIVRLIDQAGTITFDRYPKSSEYLLHLREQVNDLIEKIFVS